MWACALLCRPPCEVGLRSGYVYGAVCGVRCVYRGRRTVRIDEISMVWSVTSYHTATGWQYDPVGGKNGTTVFYIIYLMYSNMQYYEGIKKIGPMEGRGSWLRTRCVLQLVLPMFTLLCTYTMIHDTPLCTQ